MEMKQIISITLLSLFATVFANPTGVAKPEECEVDTPKYDEAACKEACAKEPYSKEPYCEDINQLSNTGETPVAPSLPGAQPGAGGVKTVVPEASPSVPSAPSAPSNTQNQQEGATLPVGNQDAKGSGLHPEHTDDHEPSGGVSLQASLVVSALCLFFKLFFN